MTLSISGNSTALKTTPEPKSSFASVVATKSAALKPGIYFYKGLCMYIVNKEIQFVQITSNRGGTTSIPTTLRGHHLKLKKNMQIDQEITTFHSEEAARDSVIIKQYGTLPSYRHTKIDFYDQFGQRVFTLNMPGYKSSYLQKYTFGLGTGGFGVGLVAG